MVLSSLGCSLAGWESCSCVGVCFPDSLLAPLLFWAPAVFPGHPPPQSPACLHRRSLPAGSSANPRLQHRRVSVSECSRVSQLLPVPTLSNVYGTPRLDEPIVSKEHHAQNSGLIFSLLGLALFLPMMGLLFHLPPFLWGSPFCFSC